MKIIQFPSTKFNEMQEFINQNNFNFLDIKQILILSGGALHDFYYLLIYKENE